MIRDLQTAKLDVFFRVLKADHMPDLREKIVVPFALSTDVDEHLQVSDQGFISD
jgi:hypothetical protein